MVTFLQRTLALALLGSKELLDYYASKKCRDQKATLAEQYG